jgi:DNA repair exonuclease SbcCD ATPase subunit
MKITRMTAENVKRLTAVEITPDGNMVVIGGKNGEGKTSVLDSIMYALAGNRSVCDRPLRDGTDKAEVEIVINHPNGDLIVKRTFTPKSGTLTIRNKEGMRYSSPQEILDKISSKLTFDPVEFMRLDRRKQFEALREAVGLDFTKADEKRKKLYDDRAVVNRQAKALSSQVNELVDYKDADEPIDVSDVVKQLEAAREHNQKQHEMLAEIASQKGQIAERHDCIEQAKEEINRLNQEINNKYLLIKQHETAIAGLEAEVKTDIDTEPLRQKLESADRKNAVWRKHEDYLQKQREYHEAEAEAKRLTTEIDNIDAWKTEQLAQTKFPVKGLNLSDENVLYKGVPLDQASSAEQLQVSAAMAAAMNPELRIMLIRGGSLLDGKSMAMLASFAEENDYQIWIERVGEGAECSVVIEDGMVKIQDEDEDGEESEMEDGGEVGPQFSHDPVSDSTRSNYI